MYSPRLLPLEAKNRTRGAGGNFARPSLAAEPDARRALEIHTRTLHTHIDPSRVVGNTDSAREHGVGTRRGRSGGLPLPGVGPAGMPRGGPAPPAKNLGKTAGVTRADQAGPLSRWRAESERRKESAAAARASGWLPKAALFGNSARAEEAFFIGSRSAGVAPARLSAVWPRAEDVAWGGKAQSRYVREFLGAHPRESSAVARHRAGGKCARGSVSESTRGARARCQEVTRELVRRPAYGTRGA